MTEVVDYVDRWREIEGTLIGAGLHDLASRVRDESETAHAAPLRIPVIGESGAGKSALIARIFGGDTASFPQDVLESTARAVAIKYAPIGYRAAVNDDTGARDECPDNARWDDLVRGRAPIADGSLLEVGLPSPHLARWNASFVDTPGMNTSTPELEGRAWAAAATAPVVILAIPAASTGRRSDVEYLVSLGDNSASVVIVLTRKDQLPEGSEQRLVDDLRGRLEERDIAPIAIVVTSAATAWDDERSGMAHLRRVLTEVTGERRARLVAHHAGGRVATQLRNELAALRLRRAALESDLSTSELHGEHAMRDIAAHGVDQESDLRAAVDKLGDRCERLRLEAFNRMHEVGEETLLTVDDEVSRLPTRNDVQQFAGGDVPRYVLRWRERCIDVANDRLGALDRELADTARGVATQQLQQVRLSTEWIQDLPAETIPQRSDRESSALQELRRSRKELLRQVDELQQRAPTSEEFDQVELALARHREERVVYEPQMDMVRLDRGRRQLQDAGRAVGNIANVALTLMPIPVGGKFGAALRRIPGGARIIGGIKKYNSLIAARDQGLRHLAQQIGRSQRPTTGGAPTGGMSAQGWMTTVLDNLSLATWGERLMGAVGDWLVPDQEVEVENAAVRQEYVERRKAHDDAGITLEHEKARLRSRQVRSAQQIGDKQAELERLERRAVHLEQSVGDAAVRRQEADAEAAGAALIGRLRVHLLGRDGDTYCADLRKAVSAGFAAAREQLERRLTMQVDTIHSEVQAALQAAREKRTEGEAAVQEALQRNSEMTAAVQAALAQVEAL